MGESESGVGVGKARESESGVGVGNSVNRLPSPDVDRQQSSLTLAIQGRRSSGVTEGPAGYALRGGGPDCFGLRFFLTLSLIMLKI